MPDEAAARRALGRKRMLANGLLLGIAVVFGLTFLDRTPNYVMGLIRSGSEAGIVGGLADWFAVTALFRRPLGLPIPHTAVLPRSKERIGRALARFIEQSFLTEAVLIPRVRAARPAHSVSLWLADPQNAAVAVRPVLGVVPDLLHALDDAELRSFLNRVVKEELREFDLAPLAGHALQILTQSGEADLLFDSAITAALQAVEGNREEIDRLVQQHSRWWIPRFVNQNIAQHICNELIEALSELLQPESETRGKLQAALAEYIGKLLGSPEQAAELNAARDRVLSHPELQAWVNAVWKEISAALARDLAAPHPRSREILENAILTLGRALASDELMQAKIDEGVERALAQALAYRGKMAGFMADVVRNWDAKTLTERFELVIGGDLQFIRMNGTVVGSIVGCVLFVLTHLRI